MYVPATNQFITGDCLEVMQQWDDKCVDLVFCSPPYEAARSYGIDFNLKGQDWVDWCIPRFKECLRVCKGLVAWVVQGQTRKFRWSATPALLMADLHRAGIHLRNPPIFHRFGIPGSGGPDWLRCDAEMIVCASAGKLPWSNPTAMGEPCRYAPGGVMSHRMKNGKRVNGKMTYQITTTDGYKDGDAVTKKSAYAPPDKANPGSVISCQVGGGRMGSVLCHETEAPFPEALAEFFIRSFCPPGGTTLDIFSGSGTTASVAHQHNRRWIGIDIREPQKELGLRRIHELATKGINADELQTTTA